MFKKKISKKEWNLLFVCIIIIAIVLIDAAVRQTYTKFSGLEKEIKSSEERLGRLNGILRHREEIGSGYKQVIAGLRQIETSDDFLQNIEESAKRVGLSIRSIKPTATKEDDLYKIYSVRIDFQDEILTLAKFLYFLSKEYKGMGIERLQINAQSQKELPKADLLISAIEFKE